MQIDLYTNHSNPRVINKNISLIKSISGTLKNEQPESILQGRLIVNYDSDFNKDICNYLYIPFYKHYYFITNIEILDNNRLIISYSVDVLMSHKTEILNLTGIISRTSDINYINTFINDENILLQQNNNLFIKRFSDKSFIPNKSLILITSGG